MFPDCDYTCTVLTSAGTGALLAVIAVTLWNRRSHRRKNENRSKPWPGQAKLYHTASFRSARCTWLLEELGVQSHVDIQPYNPFTASEEEREWYMKNINPVNEIPALHVDNMVMTESAAICMYLAAAYDALLPPQSREHEYYNWICNAAVKLDPLCRTLYRQLQKTPQDLQDADVIRPALISYATMINDINNHLATNDFMCAKELTVADIMIGYNIMWISTIKGGLLLQDYQHVKDYLARLKSRKAFQAGMGSLREWLNSPQWESTAQKE